MFFRKKKVGRTPPASPPPPVSSSLVAAMTETNKEKVEWSERMARLAPRDIEQVVFTDDISRGVIQEKNGAVHRVSIHPTLRGFLLVDLLEKKVSYRILPPTSKPLSWLAVFPLVSFFATLLLTALTGASVLRSFSGAKPPLSSFSDPFRVVVPTVSPAPWIGSPEILLECIDSIGKVKGLLLEGAPGTGKTLMARHIAYASNATLLPVVGSQFVEVFVGLGAQRVRQLFATARKHAPTIIFIDEMDAIASKRGDHSHTESDQTLNQLLAEMDGFIPHAGVFVLGATNRVSSMDPALLRPGRLDRVVHIPLPDESSRKKMYRHFLERCGMPLSTEVDVDTLGSLSQELSGAEMERVVKEAVVFAERVGATVLTNEHLDLALEKERVGILKTEDDRSHAEKWRTALHETGHAMVAHAFPTNFRVRKISIRPNHQGMGGYTLYDDSVAEDTSYTRELLQRRIMVLMGGKAAETLYYGDTGVSAGAVHDLVMANALSETMVGQLGLSSRFPTLSHRNTPLSENMRDAVHREIQETLDGCFAASMAILNGTWPTVERVATRLMETLAVNESVFLSLISTAAVSAVSA